MKSNALQMKRHFVSGKVIIGIDPSKNKHQAAILNPFGIQQSSSFTFQNNTKGYHVDLWRKIKKRIENIDPEDTVFAVEVSCNFWQKLCLFLASKGYTVLKVNPLSTYHARPRVNNSFSKSDPIDAPLVADCARDGAFSVFCHHTPHIRAMHQLAISYDKLKKDLVRNKLRLRSMVELVYPEMPKILDLRTLTALHLLSRYFTPKDFVGMNPFNEAPQIEKISRGQHGIETLKKLQEAAKESIGIPLTEPHLTAERINLSVWVKLIVIIREQMHRVRSELIRLAKMTPYFTIIKSVNGVSELTAALFIAEVRDLDHFNHFRQIEKLAGTNLRLSQSGKFTGYRRITHIGNGRLRSILYRMTEETVKRVPEIRIKFIKRQMNEQRYRKNIIACTSNLLRLIISLIQENRTYQLNPDNAKVLQELEIKYERFKAKANKYKQVG